MSQILKSLNEARGAKLKTAQEITSKLVTEKRGFTDEERNTIRGINDEVEKIDGDIEMEVRSIALLSKQSPRFSKQEERDIKRFDFQKTLRHLKAVCDGSAGILDGVEAEMVQEGIKEARDAGVQTIGLALPSMLIRGRERRDITATGGTAGNQGGVMVETVNRGLLGDLYNNTVLESNGALVLQGLRGNVDLPRYTKGANPAKKTENEAAGESSPTFDALSLSPNRLAVFMDISDQLLMQSSEMLEAFIGRELTSQFADVKELAFFHGGGTNEPVGIAGTSGIGSVVGATNGAAPDWSDMIDLETAVAIVNAASGNLAYLTNAKVRGKLKKTLVASSTDSSMIWDRRTPDAPINGYQALISNAISSTTTKGTSGATLSAMFFGNVNDFVIGYWGGLMLEMVRDTTGAKAGLRTLVANTYYDAGVLRPKSFSAMLDIITT